MQNSLPSSSQDLLYTVEHPSQETETLFPHLHTKSLEQGLVYPFVKRRQHTHTHT